MQLIDPEQVKKGEGLDNVLEDLTEGEEVTFTGRLVKTEAKLGRSLMVDFNFWDPKNSFRQVDHRTIKWIILRNKKYTYKKEGLKKKKSVETLGKTTESTSVDIDDKDLEKKTLKVETKALWNGSKLQKGNWFSSSMYVRVEKINGDKIDVYKDKLDLLNKQFTVQDGRSLEHINVCEFLIFKCTDALIRNL